MGPALHGAAEVLNDWILCRTSPPGCAVSASGPRCVVGMDVDGVPL
jgi:hypothetical protein